MIILGIDPGSARIGFGVIKKNRNLELVDYGVIECRSILEVAEKISAIVKKYKPEVAGVEKIYFSKNVKTGIEVAQARGVIIAEIAKRGITIKELSPSEIKSSVTGYGLADKKSVAKMTAKILGVSGLKGYDDASDALAIAITTATNNYLDNI